MTEPWSELDWGRAMCEEWNGGKAATEYMSEKHRNLATKWSDEAEELYNLKEVTAKEFVEELLVASKYLHKWNEKVKSRDPGKYNNLTSMLKVLELQQDIYTSARKTAEASDLFEQFEALESMERMGDSDEASQLIEWMGYDDTEGKHGGGSEWDKVFKKIEDDCQSVCLNQIESRFLPDSRTRFIDDAHFKYYQAAALLFNEEGGQPFKAHFQWLRRGRDSFRGSLSPERVPEMNVEPPEVTFDFYPKRTFFDYTLRKSTRDSLLGTFGVWQSPFDTQTYVPSGSEYVDDTDKARITLPPDPEFVHAVRVSWVTESGSGHLAYMAFRQQQQHGADTPQLHIMYVDCNSVGMFQSIGKGDAKGYDFITALTSKERREKLGIPIHHETVVDAIERANRPVLIPLQLMHACLVAYYADLMCNGDYVENVIVSVLDYASRNIRGAFGDNGQQSWIEDEKGNRIMWQTAVTHMYTRAISHGQCTMASTELLVHTLGSDPEDHSYKVQKGREQAMWFKGGFAVGLLFAGQMAALPPGSDSAKYAVSSARKAFEKSVQYANGETSPPKTEAEEAAAAAAAAEEGAAAAAEEGAAAAAKAAPEFSEGEGGRALHTPKSKKTRMQPATSDFKGKDLYMGDKYDREYYWKFGQDMMHDIQKYKTMNKLFFDLKKLNSCKFIREMWNWIQRNDKVKDDRIYQIILYAAPRDPRAPQRDIEQFGTKTEILQILRTEHQIQKETFQASAGGVARAGASVTGASVMPHGLSIRMRSTLRL